METTAPMQASRAMDRAAFSRLVAEHHRPLLAYARVLSGQAAQAEEIVQDSFIAAWQALEKFDITRDFGSWLRGIARNKWRDHCRRSRREIPLDEESLIRLEEALHRWSGPKGEPVLFDRLDHCRKKLPAPLADAVHEYYDRNQDGESSSITLGISPATFRKRLERARSLLRECLERTI